MPSRPNDLEAVNRHAIADSDTRRRPTGSPLRPRRGGHPRAVDRSRQSPRAPCTRAPERPHARRARPRRARLEFGRRLAREHAGYRSQGFDGSVVVHDVVAALSSVPPPPGVVGPSSPFGCSAAGAGGACGCVCSGASSAGVVAVLATGALSLGPLGPESEPDSPESRDPRSTARGAALPAACCGEAGACGWPWESSAAGLAPRTVPGAPACVVAGLLAAVKPARAVTVAL